MIFLSILVGCNGPKVIGNSVETYGGVRVRVADDFRYVDTVTCGDIDGWEACQQRALNYQANLFVKETDGRLDAMGLVISKSLTGTFSFYYDNTRFIDYRGERYAFCRHRYDLDESEDEPELVALVDALLDKGIVIDTRYFFVVGLAKKLDRSHKIVVGYGIPYRGEYSDMDNEAIEDALLGRLLSVMSVDKSVN